MRGTTLGNYRIIQRLAAGGMGEVYIGEHTLIGRKAAVKVLLPHVSQKPQIVERFFQEAKATAAIGHPGIVEIYDFGFHGDGRAYLVMEFLEGETLAACIKRERRLPLERSAAIIRRVASALGAAHDKGIVHRDLKPDNIFLVPAPDSADGQRVKLLDFGIAKLQDTEESALKTGTGVVMGTPAYMAPEQCRGAGRVDHRADLYALGCIFFELVCGRRPYVGVGAGELIGMQQFMPVPRPRSVWPEVDEDVEELILKLLEKQPEDRVQSTAELRAWLDELVPSHTISGIATPRPGTVRPVTRASQPLPPAADPALASQPLPPVVPARASQPLPPPRPATAQPAVPMPPVMPATPTPSPSDSGLLPMHAHAARVSVTTLHSANAESVAVEPADNSRRWLTIAGVAAVLIGIAVGGALVTGGDSSRETAEMAASATDIGEQGPDDTARAAVAEPRAGDEAAGAAAAEPGAAEPAADVIEQTDKPASEPAAADQPDIEMDTPPDIPAEITVAFATDPEGATVKRRGAKEVFCTTPCTRTIPASHDPVLFTVSKSGYDRKSVTFDGTKGGEESLTLQKRPKKSTTELPDDIPL